MLFGLQMRLSNKKIKWLSMKKTIKYISMTEEYENHCPLNNICQIYEKK